jgi:hypothetical protein
MIVKLIFLSLILNVQKISAQKDSTLTWKHYTRGGFAKTDSSIGGFGYYRINRQTNKTFRDLRVFSYNLKNDYFIYIRYKTSDKYSSRQKFYRYTTSSYRKNTRAKVALQYHFNQGLGYFINNYQNGLINFELGHAFDISDYLNATRKTSYLKLGVFWDHDTKWFSTKLEAEHFEQISEIVENNLSRNQFLFEMIIPLKHNFSININYELEDYHRKNQIDASSTTIAIGWKGNLSWSL